MEGGVDVRSKLPSAQYKGGVMHDQLEKVDASSGFRVTARGGWNEERFFWPRPQSSPVTWRNFYQPDGQLVRTEHDDENARLYVLTDHGIADSEGVPLTPVVKLLGAALEDYIITWWQVSWHEGFFIFEGKPAFLEIGSDAGWGAFNGSVRLVTGGAGLVVDRAELEAHLSPEVAAIPSGEIAALPTLLQP